jgi:O-antigen/teichoic acid export membrane protein
MFIALIIYIVYSLNHFIKEKKNIKKTIYSAKRNTLVILVILILIIIFREFLLNLIEIELYISILVGLIAAFVFAIIYLLLKE